ncbi:Thioesterase-like superfamily domain containing protein [Rhypophila sp. PSN 637]
MAGINDTPGDDPRLSYQEALALVELPPLPSSAGTTSGSVRRFMSTSPVYVQTTDYPRDHPLWGMHKSGFGGHVYAQSGLAAYKVWKSVEDQKGAKSHERLGIHTIHGYFTLAAKPDRPFVYHVQVLTTLRSLATLSVTAYQPSQPSTNPKADYFPLADGSLPLEPPSFTGIVSFKLAEAHSSGVNSQEAPPQVRFADILSSRPPSEWAPSPITDIEAIVEYFAQENQSIVGLFPMVDVKKVDMSAYNRDKPPHERREIALYRLVKPLPSPADGNDSVLVHAFAADRNGLLMVGNHNGLGHKFGKAATISNTFVVHENVDEAVMEYGTGEGKGLGNEWWVMEYSFPRTARGRGIVVNKIWSPKGVHVATEYQDGVVRSNEASQRVKL